MLALEEEVEGFEMRGVYGTETLALESEPRFVVACFFLECCHFELCLLSNMITYLVAC